MSTITTVRAGAPKRAGWVLVALMLLVIVYAVATAGLAFAPARPNRHAVQRHSAEAVAVRQCMQDPGAFAVFARPDGRIYRLCEMPDGKYGLQVMEKDDRGVLHEITAFVKNKMTRLDQVLRYLKNCGAEQIWP